MVQKNGRLCSWHEMSRGTPVIVAGGIVSWMEGDWDGMIMVEVGTAIAMALSFEMDERLDRLFFLLFLFSKHSGTYAGGTRFVQKILKICESEKSALAQ